MVRFDFGSAEKKLIEFAQWWHRPAPADRGSLADDLALSGIDSSGWEWMPKTTEPPKEFELWPENADAVIMYQRCGKLWRIDTMGGLLGLDRPGIESLMRMMLIKPKDRLGLLDKLTIIEDEAMRIINGRIKK